MTSIHALSRSLSNSIEPRLTISLSSDSGSGISGDFVTFDILLQVISRQFVSQTYAPQAEQRSAFELILIGQHDHPLNLVLQLAHVSRPVIPGKLLQDRRRKSQIL